MEALELFLLLVVGHFLADYPLQGDFLSKAKNRTAPLEGVPWYHAMVAHAAIHGGFVGVITGSIWLGLAEAVAHGLIDDQKCRGRISYSDDQFFHIALKLLWLPLALI